MARIARRIAGIGASDLPDATAFDDYVGPAREITVDQQRGIIALHDGVTPGGQQFHADIQNGSVTEEKLAPGIVRVKLIGERVFYVRPDGSDANSGLVNSSAGAFLTIPAAIAAAYAVDTNRYAVKIKVGTGTYTTGIYVPSPLLGGGFLDIEGDLTTPSNCFIDVADQHGVFADNGAHIRVRGFKYRVSGSGFSAIRADNGAVVDQGFNDFGVCSYMHIDLGMNGTVNCFWNYTISGSAVGHWHSGVPSTLYSPGITITLTGVPNFSAYFAGTATGFINCSGATFVGTATGYKYIAHKNGVIEAGGAGYDFLPGSLGGTVSSGGKYLGPNDADIESGRINILNLETEYSVPLYIRQTTDTANPGPFFVVERIRENPAANDLIGTFVSAGRNTDDVQKFYTVMDTVVINPTAGAETSQWRVLTHHAGGADVRVNVIQGLWMQGATGGDRGPGTVNAVGVYDDNVILSCYPFDQYLDGKVSLKKWDAKVPDRVHPAVFTSEVVENDIDPETNQPKVHQRKVQEERLERREHTPLRKFRERIGTEYDPLSLDGYAKHWREKRHLSAMPNEQKFDPEKSMAAGEWIQRLIETVETQAILIEQLNERTKEQEDRLLRAGL